MYFTKLYQNGTYAERRDETYPSELKDMPSKRIHNMGCPLIVSATYDVPPSPAAAPPAPAPAHPAPAPAPAALQEHLRHCALFLLC